MENLLLPRRERLFNYGGKLHFQNFSALFQGVLSTSFPSGKYHCKAKSLSKTISRLRHIIAKGNKVSLPGDASHTALLKSHCRGGNAHSYACLRLFLHASTKVSCVGFITRNLPKGKQTPWHRRVFRVYSLCELAGRSHRKMRKVRASQGRVQVKYLWRRLQGKCNRDIPHDLLCKDGKAR